MERFKKDERVLVADSVKDLRAFKDNYISPFMNTGVTGIILPFNILSDGESIEWMEHLRGKISNRYPQHREIIIGHGNKTQHHLTLKAARKLRRAYSMVTGKMPKDIYIEINPPPIASAHNHAAMTYTFAGYATRGVDMNGNFYDFPTKHLVVFNNRMTHDSPRHKNHPTKNPRVVCLMV